MLIGLRSKLIFVGTMRGWIIALCALAAGEVAAKVVREELTLTWGLGAPNGQPREMIFMNGQFPGPTFVWDEDDDVEVRNWLRHE